MNLGKETLLNLCTTLNADFTEVRIVESTSTAIQIQDGRGSKLASSHVLGAGIRVLKDGIWGFSSLENPEDRDSIYSGMKSAFELTIAGDKRWKERREIAKVSPCQRILRAKVEIDPRSIPFGEKLEKLMELERGAKKYAPREIVNTVLNYGDLWVREIISNSLGTHIVQEKIKLRLSLVVTAFRKGVRQSSHKSVAGSKGFEIIEGLTPEKFSHRVASRAVELTSAQEPPSGKFPVVLAPSVVGLFTHEAVGHNAEADSIKSGNSILAGKKGKLIASPKVTIVDDPTFKDAYGSYAYDDEGVEAGKTIIIENGILKSFLHNIETAQWFNETPTGNARAAGYASPPLVRMSNTYVLPGEVSVEEIFDTIKRGIFVEDVGFGGYVFPERGQFMFNANSSFLIENGKKTKLLRNVSLSGLTLEVLSNIEEVSKEFSLSGEGGTCGKDGQGVSVDDGGPYIKVKDMIVGGDKEIKNGRKV